MWAFQIFETQNLLLKMFYRSFCRLRLAGLFDSLYLCNFHVSHVSQGLFFCPSHQFPNLAKSTYHKYLKGCSKNSVFKFLPILMFLVSAAFRLLRCHFVKSHQSHSPLCSFFNLQKHTRK